MHTENQVLNLLDISVTYGVLYYMESSEISRIPAIRQEIRHMIMQRNELACYIRERLTLPPMLKTAHTCGRCYAKTSCFMYHKLAEDGDGETSGMREKFTELVRHLKPNHQDFFKKWDDLLTKEESEIMKFKRELWTMLSTEREKHGRCFANIRLVPGTASEDKGASKINKFRYTFQRDEGGAKNFSDSHIAVGEPIVISDEQGHYALANGYVTEIHSRHISVAVDRRLHNARTRQPGFDVDNNQVFAGIMDVEGPSTMPKTTASDGILYRLDKDEFSNGLATVRNNLIQIMTDSVFHAKEIRDFVVDDVAPRFKTTPAVYQLSGPASQLTINKDQKEAIERIMTAEDYALVLGMPGTGKTTTIAHIIRALVAKGKSVLLTSYTHTAVDNILLKIRDDNIGVLRLGAVAKIHPEVRQFAVLGAEPKTSIEDLEDAYQKPQVVATTCLGINHQVFNERIFDYCVVDEASQITLPVCLGPIRMAKTFVLVGDHYQLPPLVQNREAQEGGLDVSLFKLLSDRHPEAVTTLRHQYRMNNDIMSISNALIYDGRLVCGSPGVANRILSLSNLDSHSLLHSGSSHVPTTCWITRTLARTSTPVIFLNTDTLDTTISKFSYETISGSRTTNALEATLLTHLTSALLLAGLAPSALGVVTPYRSQLRLIRDMLTAQLSPAQTEAIEAHTADRFQGRDKEVVLMSFVRANDRGIVGELLKDWRRVNVSVTRARSKMVMIGSKMTLAQGDELLAKLVNMCEGKGWMIDLKEGMGVQPEDHDWASAGFGLGAGVTPARTRTSPMKSITVATIASETSPTTMRAPAKRAATTEIIDLASPTKKTATAASINNTSSTISTTTQVQHARTFGRVLSNGQTSGSITGKPASSIHRPFKVPRKVGKVNVENTAAGKVMGKSRLLNDVVNDVWGELGLGDAEFE
jgi:DNA replication ATP-dependent helicase Dna2